VDLFLGFHKPTATTKASVQFVYRGTRLQASADIRVTH
jgi:hypothetical protein